MKPFQWTVAMVGLMACVFCVGFGWGQHHQVLVQEQFDGQCVTSSDFEDKPWCYYRAHPDAPPPAPGVAWVRPGTTLAPWEVERPVTYAPWEVPNKEDRK